MSTALGVTLPGVSITSIVERVLNENAQKTKEGQLPVVKLGAGLIQSGEDILAVRAGILQFQKPNKFYLENRQKRYIPAPNDLVIGVVTARLADAYKIDLGSNSQATLNFTGFEGTTKKNRPNLSIGDVVYARVSIANKDMEPELVCLDAENRSEGFGEIKDGMMLQMFDNWVLELLGKHLAFEIIIGVNGRFIVNATKPTYVIKIANIIRNSPNHDAKWVMEKIKSVARG